MLSVNIQTVYCDSLKSLLVGKPLKSHRPPHSQPLETFQVQLARLMGQLASASTAWMQLYRQGEGSHRDEVDAVFTPLVGRI